MKERERRRPSAAREEKPSKRDVTYRKRAEEELERTSRQRQLALDAARMGWWHYDPITRIASWDDRYKEIFGVSGHTRPNDEILAQIIHPDDLPALWAKVEAALDPTDPKPYKAEYRINRPDGVTRWVEAYGIVTFEGTRESRRAVSMVGTVADITDRKNAEEEQKRAEAALRESEARFRLALRNAPVSVAAQDRSLRFIWAYNQRSASPDQIIGHTDEEIFTPEEAAHFRAIKRRVLDEGVELHEETWLYRPSGRMFLDIRWEPIRDQAGTVVGVASATVDLTPVKLAEEALLTAVQRLHTLLAGMRSSILFVADDSRVAYANDAFCRYFGLSDSPDDLVGLASEAMIARIKDTYLHPEAQAARIREIVRLRQAVTGEEIVMRDGRTCLRDFIPVTSAGVSYGRLWQHTDITERKKAEEAIRASEERLSFALETSRTGAWDLDLDDHSAYRSFEHDRIFGYERPLPQWTYEMFLEHVLPEDRERVDAKFREAAGTGGMWNFECRIRRADGEVRWIWAAGRHRGGGDGGSRRMAGIVQDITERKQADVLRQALAEQERLRLGAAVEQASDAVIMVDLDGTIRYVNAAFESINRLDRDKAIDRSYFDLVESDPSSGDIRDAVAEGRLWHGPLVRPVPEGHPVELEVTISPAKEPSGAVVGGLVTEKDVTQENALQRQVRQSQKMEALGTLAGGITHDFNNILGTIIINTELALLDLDPADPARRPLPNVLLAANRGKELVKQIITFSRQRAWERKPVEIAPVVNEGLRFLRSTLPKDIAIDEKIDTGSGVVMADPSHIHQILVNLCQNAVLAMRDCGGWLDVRLAPLEIDETMVVRHPDLKLGPYVRLTVSDTGCGMTSELVERIFEPFFTTRGPGGGSGLGLAVVHGIVKTYNGAITVYSELGKGSTFSVYLPRHEGEASIVKPDKTDEPARGEERILLVEDEEPQRTSLAQGLGRLGYRVTARADGRSALDEFRKDPGAYDLVVTDQTMPLMTGIELAEALAKIRPGLPVVLCTGFSEKVNGGAVGTGGIRELIMKPFTLQEITRLIRRVVK